MTLFKIFDQSGSFSTGIIIFLIFIAIIASTTFLLTRKHKFSNSTIGLGFLVYLLSSIISLEILMNFLFFKDGSYNNYGLGESFLRLFSGLVISFFIGLFLTRFFYSRQNTSKS